MFEVVVEGMKRGKGEGGRGDLPMLAMVPPWRIPRRFWGGGVSGMFMR